MTRPQWISSAGTLASVGLFLGYVMSFIYMIYLHFRYLEASIPLVIVQQWQFHVLPVVLLISALFVMSATADGDGG